MISLSDSDECDWESDMAVQRCLEESLHKDKIYEGYAMLYIYICLKEIWLDEKKLSKDMSH